MNAKLQVENAGQKEQQHSRVLKQEKDEFVDVNEWKKPKGREEGQHIRPKTTVYGAACTQSKPKTCRYNTLNVFVCEWRIPWLPRCSSPQVQDLQGDRVLQAEVAS